MSEKLGELRYLVKLEPRPKLGGLSAEYIKLGVAAVLGFAGYLLALVVGGMR